MKKSIFIIDIIIHLILLGGICWSIRFPEKRIWPPPHQTSWQFKITWICFYSAFAMNGLLLFVDWDSWIISGKARFPVGILLVVGGVSLVIWGILSLGVKNTSGIKNGFRQDGPYRFIRNPQYLADIFIFIGLIIVSNSLFLAITNCILSIVFLLTPLAEEPWLEWQYGEEYLVYKQSTPRFL